MSLFLPMIDPNAHLVFRLDPAEPLGCAMHRPFVLDGHEWPTAEHYYQAMKYPGRRRFHDILTAPTVELARKHGRGWLKRKRADWSRVRLTVLMRALYTQSKAYPEFAAALEATAERPLVETSQYDYFWGVGRDQRGNNHYGQLLMTLRDKLRAEAAAALSKD